MKKTKKNIIVKTQDRAIKVIKWIRTNRLYVGDIFQ